MNEDDTLIGRLAGDLRPIRPQRARTGWGLLALAMLATGIGVHALFGPWPGTVHAEGGAWSAVGGALLAVLGMACAHAVIGMASPRRVGRPAAFWVVIAASVMPLAAVVLLLVPGVGGQTLARVHGHWQCALLGTLSGALVAAALVYWLRRGAPASPARAGLYAGIATGALGSAIYGLACPVTGFGHWSTWHFVPVLVCALVGRFLLPRFLRW